MKKPTLCIVAGPNGSGKTTTTIRLLHDEWGADSVYINPDEIAQQVFGDWNSKEAVLQAAQLATQKRYECLEQKTNFVFETVFSSEEKVEFVRKAKAAGFFVRFFFVCTCDPSINAARVAHRYMDGGHEVPIPKIISRYYKSIENARKILPEVDRAYIYDNSVDNQLPQLLYRMVEGKIYKQYVEQIPDWAQTLL